MVKQKHYNKNTYFHIKQKITGSLLRWALQITVKKNKKDVPKQYCNYCFSQQKKKL